MPIRKWTNWDQYSVHDNLWELLARTEAGRSEEDLQRHYNESFFRHSRERRLRGQSEKPLGRPRSRMRRARQQGCRSRR